MRECACTWVCLREGGASHDSLQRCTLPVTVKIDCIGTGTWKMAPLKAGTQKITIPIIIQLSADQPNMHTLLLHLYPSLCVFKKSAQPPAPPLPTHSQVLQGYNLKDWSSNRSERRSHRPHSGERVFQRVAHRIQNKSCRLNDDWTQQWLALVSHFWVAGSPFL